MATQTERIVERTTSQNDGGSKALSAQEYLHKPLSAVVTPLLVAGITGLLVGALVLAIGIWKLWLDAWAIGLITWLSVTLVVWILMQVQRTLLIVLEKLTGLDINGDGYVGKPGQQKPSQPMGVRVTLRHLNEQGHLSITRELTLPGDPAAIVTMATSFLGGASMAERMWMGEGKLFSPTDYRAIMRILREEKLIQLKNSRNDRDGYELTAQGRVMMEQVRDQYSARVTPPPLD